MAIIAHDQVKMAPLAIVGSFSVNGVAALHTEILKKREMNDFYQVFPEKFNNKTNGITHQRWLLKLNLELSFLITESIGSTWIDQPEQLQGLLKFREDATFLDQLKAFKQRNKEKLAKRIKLQTGMTIDPSSIFDVHVKRLHAYKRQLLNVLHIMHLYNCLRESHSSTYVYFWSKGVTRLLLCKKNHQTD